MQQKKPAFYCGIETNYSFLSIKQITMDKIFLHIKSTRKLNRRVNDIAEARQHRHCSGRRPVLQPFPEKEGGYINVSEVPSRRSPVTGVTTVRSIPHSKIAARREYHGLWCSMYITRQHRSFSSPSSRFPEIEADSGDP